MPDNHFIETNIIIVYTVDWDRQFPAIQSYVEGISQKISVHSSERVLTEAETVVSERRRLTKQAARRVFEDFSGQRPIADQDMINFIRRELNQHADNAVDHVLQFVKEEMSLFKSLAATDIQKALTRTIQDIDSEFDRPITLIDDIRREVHQDLKVAIRNWREPDYETIYSEYGSMKSLLPNSPLDRDILFDAHHLCTQENMSPLGFITMDRSDILGNKQAIESLLQDLVIQHPGDV